MASQGGQRDVETHEKACRVLKYRNMNDKDSLKLEAFEAVRRVKRIAQSTLHQWGGGCIYLFFVPP